MFTAHCLAARSRPVPPLCLSLGYSVTSTAAAATTAAAAAAAATIAASAVATTTTTAAAVTAAAIVAITEIAAVVAAAAIAATITQKAAVAVTAFAAPAIDFGCAALGDFGALIIPQTNIQIFALHEMPDLGRVPACYLLHFLPTGVPLLRLCDEAVLFFCYPLLVHFSSLCGKEGVSGRSFDISVTHNKHQCRPIRFIVYTRGARIYLKTKYIVRF